MNVALIGLGDIAQKAYLPALTGRAGLNLHLMTRNRAKLDAIGGAYRIDERFTDLDALLARELDAAFVHAPTDQHVRIVSRLLDAGVRTYVDKPLDRTLEGSRGLVEQSEKTGTPLMVGFNRRYAPGYVQALDRPRDVIVLQKNRPGVIADIREVIYDDFIHVVDTLRFLLPGPVEHTHISGRTSGPTLDHVALTLIGHGFTAIGIMHRLSGSTEEKLELMGDHAKQEVIELTQIIDHHGHQARLPLDGWTPVARQRGIEQACAAFLDGDLPDLQDALQTHELCEQIVDHLETPSSPRS